MDPQTRLYLAAAFQLGLPVVLALVAATVPVTRRWVVVVLGALTPLLLSFAVTTVRHLGLGEEEAGWAFHEMWLTSVVPYVACLTLGAALGMLRMPASLSARYILGLAPTAAVALLLALWWPQ